MGKARVYRGWRVVIGAGIGVGFGSAVFISAAFPLFAAAFAGAYGWSQADVANGASLALLLQGAGYAASGFLIDRWGSRKVASASIFLFALALAALASTHGVYWRYLCACAAIGLLAAATNMAGYARAISNWFDARRGLAMGVAAGFQALGAVAFPTVSQKLIGASGISTAALALAAFEAAVCLPLVLWLVEDDPARRGHNGEGGAATAAAATPLSDPRATFIKLAVSFAIMGFTFYAVVANIAFILSAAGLNAGAIARLQAISGLCVLIGRVGFGRALDRLPAVAVGGAALAAAAAFCFGVAYAEHYLAALGGVMLGGLAIGGESNLLPYMASRYWGRERMSRILGLFLMAFILGAAAGPVTLAHASAALGGARTALLALVLLQAAPAALFLTLPSYPRPPT